MKYFKKITLLAFLFSANVGAQIISGNAWKINVGFKLKNIPSS